MRAIATNNRHRLLCVLLLVLRSEGKPAPIARLARLSPEARFDDLTAVRHADLLLGCADHLGAVLSHLAAVAVPPDPGTEGQMSHRGSGSRK